MESIQLQSGQLEYYRFGNGKKNLLILPGVSPRNVLNSAVSIKNTFSKYTSDYTLYVIPPRRPLPDGFTVRRMADDVAKLLQTLQIAQTDVYGASQGGMIAQWLAIDHPDRVGKLVLGCTCCRNNAQSKKVFARWLDLAKSGNVDATIRDFTRSCYSEDFLKQYFDGIVSILSEGPDEDLPHFVRLVEACLSFDASKELSKITCPTLVLGSWKDEVLSAAGAIELAQILNCESFLYPDNGHAAFDETPDFYNRMLRFLTADK